MHWARHLVKLLMAVELIGRPQGATIDELVEHLKVNKRTAYRLIETMDEMDFPFCEATASLDRKKRYQFIPSYLKKLPNLSVPDLRLSLSEIIALSFIRRSGGPFKGTDVEKHIESAFKKMDAFIPEKFVTQLDKVRTLFTAPGRFTKDYRDKDEVIGALTDAMFKQRTCLVEYHSFGEDKVKHFKIDPLRFVERDGGLYVFVKATSFGNILVLAVERVLKLTPTDDCYKVPKNFDPDTLLKNAFNLTYDDPVAVKVRFSADQARYVKERRWADKQTLTDQPDGSVILEMETSGRWDVKRWVLAYGADAEVLEPEDLRREIAEEINKMALGYSRQGQSSSS
jgi:predicted DNA-binding transcriptional regulator YafY